MSKPKKLQYNGDSKVLKYLVTCANWFLDNHTVGTLDDVILTDIADGQILKYDSATSKFVNADESEGGGGSNVTPNPQGQPTDTLTKIGIGETTQTYYTENSQLYSTEGVYVTSNLDTTLVNGDYTLHIIDGQTEFDEDFTYDGSTVTLNLTHGYDTYDIEITSTTVGMTYGNGAWRNIYCDIYSESSGQTIYDLGTSADKVSYDNTTSGLTADDVQEAIDELADEKVDKVAGKGLSTNDFTDTLKDKLDGIEVGAQVNTVDSVNGKTGVVTLDKSDVGLGNVDNTSDADKPISTATQTALNAKANTTDLGTASGKNFTTSVTQGSTDLITSGAVYNEFANLPKPVIFKGTLGVNGTITSLPTASSDNEGWEYKVITAGTYADQPAKYGDTFISDGTQWVYIPSGDETDTDTWRGINVNGTQLLGNGISSGNVNFKSGTNAQVSGSGNDVTVDVDTTFSDASSRANIASGDSIKTILGKIKKWFADLKTVAFSGSYNDLSNTPTIPTVNNGTLTIQKNGSNVATFSANQSGNATANIVVPTKTSELTNDSGYISDIPFTVIDGKLCLKYVKG